MYVYTIYGVCSCENHLSDYECVSSIARFDSRNSIGNGDCQLNHENPQSINQGSITPSYNPQPPVFCLAAHMRTTAHRCSE